MDINYDSYEVKTLLEFLSFPLWETNDIFKKFRKISKNYIYRRHSNKKEKRFLFVPGNRKDKVVLVAHADTVFTMQSDFHELKISNGIISNCSKVPVGIGADDRAGCAILWLMKDSGHSILLTDGEENGCLGTKFLMEKNDDVADLINSHNFMVQFDRRNAMDFKCYDVGTDEFREYINAETGYQEPNRQAETDIKFLCRDICGVNFSIGYYNEHWKDESLNIAEWLNTYNVVNKMLSKELKRFELN